MHARRAAEISQQFFDKCGFEITHDENEAAAMIVVRPGFVKSKMTSGLDEAPLAVTPDQVAECVVDAIKSKRELVWVPGPLRVVMSCLRHVPRPLFRKLPI